MRIWDQISPAVMCRQHLLGEHRELHGLFNIHHLGKRGYSRHPETVRWLGRLPALKQRHDDLVREMLKRGWNHASPLPDVVGEGSAPPAMDDQLKALRLKGCTCKV
jgi:hypothetical protein